MVHLHQVIVPRFLFPRLLFDIPRRSTGLECQASPPRSSLLVLYSDFKTIYHGVSLTVSLLGGPHARPRNVMAMLLDTWIGTLSGSLDIVWCVDALPLPRVNAPVVAEGFCEPGSNTAVPRLCLRTSMTSSGLTGARPCRPPASIVTDAGTTHQA